MSESKQGILGIGQRSFGQFLMVAGIFALITKDNSKGLVAVYFSVFFFILYKYWDTCKQLENIHLLSAKLVFEKTKDDQQKLYTAYVITGDLRSTMVEWM